MHVYNGLMVSTDILIKQVQESTKKYLRCTRHVRCKQYEKCHGEVNNGPQFVRLTHKPLPLYCDTNIQY